MKPPKMVLMTETELQNMLQETAEKTVLEMTKNAHKLNDDVLFTVSETCEFLHVTRCTLNKWEKDKILLPQRIGSRVFYKKSELLKRQTTQYIKA